ncbi:MAG: arginine repressor [Eubacteriales bacterium]
MTKKDRQKVVLDLINEFEIDTQEELTAKLNERGIEVTQATISRDINELNLIKIAGKAKKYKYAQIDIKNAALSEKIVSLFREIVVSITCVNNLIVVKTLSGNAQAAGMVIDKMNIPQVLGSIAGDDTLLIVTKSNTDADIMIKKLKEMMG